MEILSASPERLVVLLFDHLVVNLHRVRIAIDNNDITMRAVSLSKARGIVSELLVTLDFEKGARIAADLGSLYSWLLGEMADVGTLRNARHVDRLLQIAETLRAGFTGVASLSVPARRTA